MLTNTDDEDVHDLVLDTGAHSGRLAPGETASVEVGVVGRDLEGWCSVIGHKQMGMVLTVDVSGSAPTTPAGTSRVTPPTSTGPAGTTPTSPRLRPTGPRRASRRRRGTTWT